MSSEVVAKPIRDLHLRIAGSPLEPLIVEIERELEAVGLHRVRPRFYLSTEWGVPSGTVTIAIPFYLVSPELTALHAERAGLVEGLDEEDILRYLRHEVGHAINYAYRIYDREDWVRVFGSFTQPYVEEYHPEPFSLRFVRNLPGWYAQKHPDEDWAETFAVWLNPGIDWRREYRHWPAALAKLELCDRIIGDVRRREPLVTKVDLEEDVRSISYSVDQYYRDLAEYEPHLPPGLDGALRAVFHPRETLKRHERSRVRAAASLIADLEPDLLRNVYRWTGHFPERTRALLRALAEEAERVDLAYPVDRERCVAVALTALVTSLAMNHVIRGTYLP